MQEETEKNKKLLEINEQYKNIKIKTRGPSLCMGASGLS